MPAGSNPTQGDGTDWESTLPSLVSEMLDSYESRGGVNFQEELPSKEEVTDLLDHLLAVVFPGYFGLRGISKSDAQYVLGNALHGLYASLRNLVERSLRFECDSQGRLPTDECARKAARVALGLLRGLPRIRALLQEDVQAAYDGDPAAKSIQEIIMSYPAVVAIATYRLAHELHREGVPYLPRMMTEEAHSLTGIDIHPGAEIGRSFFIDHGTGVVIGETTVIGSNVKLYQGVTLGALSFPKDERGRIIKGGKRHPTVEDNVVIYSGATILGGKTVIGHDSVIGGNCWIVSSVPPNTKVNECSPD
jgi:serine O-acetyltransferase